MNSQERKQIADTTYAVYDKITGDACTLVDAIKAKCDPMSEAAIRLDECSRKLRKIFKVMANAETAIKLDQSPPKPDEPTTERAAAAFRETLDDLGVDSLISNPKAVAEMLKERVGAEVVIMRVDGTEGKPEDTNGHG